MDVTKFIAVFLFICMFISLATDRLPQAINDEMYDKLKTALEDGKFQIKRNSSSTEKRVYRLFHSKKYELRKVYNPVLEEKKKLS